MNKLLMFVALALAVTSNVLSGSVSAQQLAAQLAVVYGPEETIYGSCRPALTLTNTGKEAIDYVQIDVGYALRDGRIVVGEQKSRYLHGVANPIAPGASRALVIHHDEATPFAAACGDVIKATVRKITCRTASGANCDGLVALRQDGDLALPKR